MPSDPPRSRSVIATLVACLAACAATAPASTHAQAVPTVRFSTEVPRLDGRLDDAVWARADSVTGFTQRDPAEGTSASERTVVRFVGTPEGLWVGVWAYDRQPAGIRRAQLRRDADFSTDDSFTLMLSPTATSAPASCSP